MIYQVRHRSLLSYAAPIAHAQFNLRLRPIAWPGQNLRHYSLALRPQPSTQSESSGPYLVNTNHLTFTGSLADLDVECEMEIAVDPLPEPGSGPTLADVRQAALSSRDLTSHSPVPYLFASRIAEDDPEIGNWATPHLAKADCVIPAVSALNSAIHAEFSYHPGATTSTTPPTEAFHARSGVCQDFAHVMIIALRAHGIPAAYVSGYLRTIPPPGMERLVGADAMHAWVAVWCGTSLGWVGFDPTNDCLARTDHITIAMGRDYADIAPIDGVFVGVALQDMDVAVDVIPLD